MPRGPGGGSPRTTDGSSLCPHAGQCELSAASSYKDIILSDQGHPRDLTRPSFLPQRPQLHVQLLWESGPQDTVLGGDTIQPRADALSASAPLGPESVSDVPCLGDRGRAEEDCSGVCTTSLSRDLPAAFLIMSPGWRVREDNP